MKIGSGDQQKKNPDRGVVVAGPTSVDDLSQAELLDVLDQLEVLQRPVLRRLRDGPGEPSTAADRDETLLTVAEVAERLEMSTDWVTRDAGKLPFTWRVGKRSLRFSSSGLSEWLRGGRG